MMSAMLSAAHDAVHDLADFLLCPAERVHNRGIKAGTGVLLNNLHRIFEREGLLVASPGHQGIEHICTIQKGAWIHRVNPKKTQTPKNGVWGVIFRE